MLFPEFDPPLLLLAGPIANVNGEIPLVGGETLSIGAKSNRHCPAKFRPALVFFPGIRLKRWHPERKLPFTGLGVQQFDSEIVGGDGQHFAVGWNDDAVWVR